MLLVSDRALQSFTTQFIVSFCYRDIRLSECGSTLHKHGIQYLSANVINCVHGGCVGRDSLSAPTTCSSSAPAVIPDDAPAGWRRWTCVASVSFHAISAWGWIKACVSLWHVKWKLHYLCLDWMTACWISWLPIGKCWLKAYNWIRLSLSGKPKQQHTLSFLNTVWYFLL